MINTFYIDVDWIGVESLALHASSIQNIKLESYDNIKKCEKLERKLKYQDSSSKEIIDQLKQLNKFSQDHESQLQESLAHTSESLKIETDTNKKLKDHILELEEKLAQVESFLSSDEGNNCLLLEEELASSKLRIAELESYIDELKVKSVNRSGASSVYEAAAYNTMSVLDSINITRS